MFKIASKAVKHFPRSLPGWTASHSARWLPGWASMWSHQWLSIMWDWAIVETKQYKNYRDWAMCTLDTQKCWEVQFWHWFRWIMHCSYKLYPKYQICQFYRLFGIILKLNCALTPQVIQNNPCINITGYSEYCICLEHRIFWIILDQMETSYYSE